MDYPLYLRAYFNIYVGNYGQAFEYADNLYFFYKSYGRVVAGNFTYMYIQIMIAFDM